MGSPFWPGLRHTPTPGTRLVRHKGDTVTFQLLLPEPRRGQAWLRTNVGKARIRRRERIEFVERGRPLLEQDWHDQPMRREGPCHFALRLPLSEVGWFQAKAFFLPEGESEPLWPEGENVSIKVDPAWTAGANMIYGAFVRQFGPNRDRDVVTADDRQAVEFLERAGYAVIPRSGTFRDLARQLDFIIGTLGFRILQLLPIHPTPTTYARMGRYGSPFAALDFKDVDPALAEFDRKTTPLEQFGELVDAVHARGARLFLDIPVNHTGWASRLQDEHPEWFSRGADRVFESPGAWGVTWEDLSKLDYRHRELWAYMAEVFLFWCRRGVDGFRCDAGYMVPLPAWEYITAKVREEYPDTVFLLEGLGGKIDVVQELLAQGGLTWAYSELFQNYDRTQVETYLMQSQAITQTCGLLVHFAETHDNPRLAARSQRWARLRTALCALTSFDGAFGVTNGVEWFAGCKIDVHDAPPLRWGDPQNQVDHMARLNAILESHPAFHPGASLRLIHHSTDEAVAVLRESGADEGRLLVVANLSDTHPARVVWSAHDEIPDAPLLYDLLTEKTVALNRAGNERSIELEPGTVLALTAHREALHAIKSTQTRRPHMPERVRLQSLRAKTMELASQGDAPVTALSPSLDWDKAAARLAKNPRDNPLFPPETSSAFPRVTTWTWPRDVRRQVVIPPGHHFLVRSKAPFTAELRESARTIGVETAMAADDGSWFARFCALPIPLAPRLLTLVLMVHEKGGTQHAEASLLALPPLERVGVRQVFTHRDLDEKDLHAIAVNGQGALTHVRAAWGEIRSQYDALLAANLHPDYPVDRQILFARCRAWVVLQGYSRLVERACQKIFSIGADGRLHWRFRIPVGRGKIVPLEITLRMLQGRNAICLEFTRPPSLRDQEHLPDRTEIRLILRPDVEDRCHHFKTKAYQGPESHFRESVGALPRGFRFAPTPDHALLVETDRGTFVPEPEWHYRVAHPIERERGLDDCSDLFSPGYFSIPLRGGHCATLTAVALRPSEPRPSFPSLRRRSRTVDPWTQEALTLDEALTRALRQFLVKRGAGTTVLAGYPWFLDWGRDTLIVLRGLIASNLVETAVDILCTIAGFESHGTLPNMIRGQEVVNRDTSDAPLWLFVVCADLLGRLGQRKLLSLDVGDRSLGDVLRSIATHLIHGTPNGMRMDSESGLLFSPAHFTWMDTNHPAGTPREGYPVEIQALWYAALSFLRRTGLHGPWDGLAERVRDSVMRLYCLSPPDGPRYLSDCLHGRPDRQARAAEPDDALRPNQLLAITLGLVEEGTLGREMLDACEELLVPGAIRSLADRPVRYPLPIRQGDRLLNDPYAPYWGQYKGEEDTRRKPAYHNGTAWTWLFPSYAEALVRVYGESARATAAALLGGTAVLMNRGCVGQVPEITDGDAPHTLRGCGAQAWGVSECLRVLRLITGATPSSGRSRRSHRRACA